MTLEVASSLRPEAVLLLRCAMALHNEAATDAVRRLLRTDLDWTWIEQQARSQGILPLVRRRLATAGPEWVPPSMWDRLCRADDANTQRNLLLTAELLHCLAVMSKHHIAALPFRGPVLAWSVYGDLALRQFDDLDVLVQRQDILHARDLLLAQGYRPLHLLTAAQEDAFLRAQGSYTLLRDDAVQVIMELHCRVAEDYFSVDLAAEDLWQRRRVATFAGREVPTLAPEDLLLTCCIHGTKHLWRRLNWICDVDWVMAAFPDLCWCALVERATALHAERMLLLGLYLAGSLFSARVPPQLYQRAEVSAAVRALALQVQSRLFRERPAEPTLRGNWIFHLRARERWSERLRYSLLLAITPSYGDWAALRLPASLMPAYYLLRPVRLLVTVGAGSLRRHGLGAHTAARSTGNGLDAQ